MMSSFRVFVCLSTALLAHIETECDRAKCQTGDGEGRLSCTGQEEARSPMCARGEGEEQQEEDLLGTYE